VQSRMLSLSAAEIAGHFSHSSGEGEAAHNPAEPSRHGATYYDSSKFIIIVISFTEMSVTV